MALINSARMQLAAWLRLGERPFDGVEHCAVAGDHPGAESRLEREFRLQRAEIRAGYEQSIERFSGKLVAREVENLPWSTMTSDPKFASIQSPSEAVKKYEIG